MHNQEIYHKQEQMQVFPVDQTLYNDRSSSRIKSKFDTITVAGTRPELVKLSEFIRLFNNDKNGLLYTGQHFSPSMKDVFLEQLGITPDIDLRCCSSEIEVLKENIMLSLKDSRPANIIVYGDTNSSMAAALAARELGSNLIHLEAGVRDFDLAVPEEITRIRIDSMSDLLLAPSDFCKMCLTYEAVRGHVKVTGNLIVDVCKKLSKVATKPRDLNLPQNFVLLTMHRPENVDDISKLKLLKKHLSEIDDTVVFPVHPRTRSNFKRYDISLPSNVIQIEPAGYMDFLYLLKNCKVVVTDSGGVQEESIILKKPCITLRHTSARWETILLNSNRLFPLDRNDSLGAMIDDMSRVKILVNPYGEDVARTTCKVINDFISTTP